MSQNPSGGNQNAGGLPNVGPNDPIRANDINKLSAAIAKATPGLSSGINSAVTPGGTVFHASRVTHKYHPWMVTKKGSVLHIEMGHFFWDNSMASGINQVAFNSDQYLNGGRNAWLFNSAFGGAAPFLAADVATASFHMGGAEIWIDDKDANIMTNKQMYVGMDGWYTKAKVGLYYIEIAAWGGRQMALPYTGQIDAQQSSYNQTVAIFNAYSTVMKGKLVPQVRFAPNPAGPDADPELVDQWSKKSLVYPICTVDIYGGIWQGISSDIYHVGSTPTCPFTVTLVKDSNQWKASIHPGLVNQTVPKIDGSYIDATPTPLLPIQVGQRIYLKATQDSSKFFPRTVDLVALPSTPENTLNEGYAQIASIGGTAAAPTVTQLSCGNKLVNRYKMGADGAYWQWSG